MRDFSLMLAVLLDADIPEDRAMLLAVDGTVNFILANRAEAVVRALDRGETLPKAIRLMDPSGELRWRLDNASHAPGGFLRALEGWHESLEAHAFAQEQAAAQIISTAMILLAGLTVGLFAYELIAPIATMMDRMAGW